MTKKASKWVTLSDEQSKTPAIASKLGAKQSKSQKSTDVEPVQHKIFWATSFAVLVVVTFALVAPKQFTNLIQGNLFDTSGLPTPTVQQKIGDNLNILPNGDTVKTPETVKTPVVSKSAPATKVVTQEATPVVQPTTTPETIQIQPITTTTQSETPTVPESQTKAPSVTQTPTVPESQTKAPSVTQTPVATQTKDSNQILLNKLAKQVDQLQQKEDSRIGVVQDLIGTVQEKLAEPKLFPSAPKVPTVTATTVLGENAVASKGYRSNTHLVTLQPGVVLQQNQNLISKTAAQTDVKPLKYQTQLANVQATPESGPAEVFVIALIIAMIGFTVYKVVPTHT